MRILVGKYKNRRLQSTLSPRVRPTARRLREALFDFLGPRIINARFLDLCAGSGAVGIEALSRGAARVTFVDRSEKMCKTIELNLEQCGAGADQSELVLSDAMDFLRGPVLLDGLVWDLAFLDPPYSTDYSPVLAVFGSGAALKPRGGVLVVEHRFETPLEATIGVLRRWRVIKQGESCLSFYEGK
jgi:16S rRNA (guanine(966)-N(2))-methyltransferase RsmD